MLQQCMIYERITDVNNGYSNLTESEVEFYESCAHVLHK